MKSRIAVVPADDNNLKHFDKLEKSLRKFHSEEELPLVRVNNPNPQDGNFWYRACPIVGKEFLRDYETVIKLDADQIILAPINEVWEGNFDIGVVLNDPSYPIQVWDITHPKYYNAGLVVMKSKRFVDNWLKLCFSAHFNNYQYREQDLLTILCEYADYNVKQLDGQKLYGEIAKPFWSQFEMRDGKVMIGDQQLCIYHAGGGNDPSKGNYRVKFKPEVVDYIEGLLK